jgi:hypothetical protein
MPADAFREAIADSPAFTRALNRYTQALFTLVAQSSACNRLHMMTERCARWLLHTHDRVGRDEFPLTHQFLSQMLGVRRATVTVAALALQRADAIRYTRGRVTVVDRARLEAAACECYGVIRSTFDRLLGGTRTASPIAGLSISDGGLTTAGDGTPIARPDTVRAVRP